MKEKLFYTFMLLCLSFSLSAQQLTVSGTITDAKDGSPIPGANVVIENTLKGVVTDLDGKFTINAESTATLSITFVGYTSQKVAIEGRTSINVALDPDVMKLNEVVVIGYGSQKKREFTSSIVSVGSEDFNKGAISDPMQLLQGKVAGFSVSKANGADPNSDAQIQLRGMSSINLNADPLVIIDGVPGGKISSVSPENIESINILRDGSAAAIYGTRGNNGVVIITTKKGKKGTTAVSYSGYLSTEQVSNRLNVLDSTDFKIKAKELKKPIQDGGENTNWMDQILRDPISQVHNIMISGGSDNLTYMGSLNYRKLQGIVIGSDRDVLNSRINLTQKALDDKLTIQTNISNTTAKLNYIPYEVYRYALTYNPTAPVTNDDGTYYQESGFENQNPVAMLKQRTDEGKVNTWLMSSNVTIELFKGLKSNTLVAYQSADTTTGYYEQISAYQSAKDNYKGLARRSYKAEVTKTLESTLDYAFSIDKSTINIMGGYSYQNQVYETFNAENRGFLTDAFTYNNLGSGTYLQDGKAAMGSYKESADLIAFFGRAMYSYEDLVFLSGSVRREGSSKFGTNNKWGIFPAVSAAVRIKNLSFLKDISAISDLKVRAGYGVTGNSGIRPYRSYLRYSPGAYFLYNGEYIKGYNIDSNPNADLKWEEKAEQNYGIDFSFLNDRIGGSIDYYIRNTEDVLFDFEVPSPPYLYGTLTSNVATLENSGFELLINANPVRSKNFNWNVTFNYSYNKNMVKSLSNNVEKGYQRPLGYLPPPGLTGVYTYVLEEGKPLGNIYGHILDSITTKGKWAFRNLDTIAKIDAKDRTIIGNGLPNSSMGITNNFTFFNFDLSFMFRGVFGFDIVNVKRIYFENQSTMPLNILSSAKDLTLNDSPAFSDYYVEKGDFIKLDNVTLGYTFPKLKVKYLKKARVYVSGNNLLTFTNYTGIDPEIGINGLTPGFDDRAAYPRTRTYTVGINVEF